MCATSIGSTFSQSPVPGVRKSGMPDGTEIPAPVSTTARSAPRSSSARRAAPVRRRRGRAHLPWNFGLALAEEGADALLGVLGAERLAEASASTLEALVEVARRRETCLICCDRERRLLGQLARPTPARCRTARGRAPPGSRGPAVAPRSASIGSPIRFISSALASPTSRGSRWVPPKPGMIPRLISGWPKRGRLGGDPEVAGHRQLAAAAEGDRVDRGDRDGGRLLHRRA